MSGYKYIIMRECIFYVDKNREYKRTQFCEIFYRVYSTSKYYRLCYYYFAPLNITAWSKPYTYTSYIQGPDLLSLVVF